jgi:polyhydroxyalkanoate synthesis regulator protein
MLLKDKKKMLPTIILRKLSNGEEHMQERPESAGAEIAESEDLYAVADEVLEAIRQNDTRALKNAMESFVECCMNKEPKKMESESDDSEY